MKTGTLMAHIVFFLSLALIAGCGENTNTSTTIPTSTLRDSQPCMACHGTAISPVTGMVIAEEWKLSRHNTEVPGKKIPDYGAGCIDCHEPESGHSNNCGRCHGGPPAATNVTGLDVTANPDTALKCFKCHHTLMAPHFNNLTSGNYPASYVSSNNLGKCRNCHNPHDPTSQIAAAGQWAKSGHGDTGSANAASPWSAADFKTRGNSVPAALTYGAICVRCHTTTGYLNFVKSGFSDVSAWGVSTDKTKELLGCNACHDDGRGNAYGYQVRKIINTGKGISAYYNFSTANSTGSIKINNSPTVYPDAATSNLCMPCHVGREIGVIIKRADQAGLNFGNVSRISSHDFLAGANLFQKSGFEFYTSAARYQHFFLHNTIGMSNQSNTGTSGPCIGCHMSSPQKHLFLPISSAGGIIQAITSTMCANCHKTTAFGDSTHTSTKLQEEKDGLASAKEALRAMEIARGLYIFNSTTNRYAYTKNWNTLYGSAIVPGSGGIHAGAYTMGASFNFNMLNADPGAYAHNSIYTRMLLYDSIDWLNDGVMNMDTELAINSLSIPPETKVSAIKYLQGTDTNPEGVGGTRSQ